MCHDLYSLLQCKYTIKFNKKLHIMCREDSNFTFLTPMNISKQTVGIIAYKMILCVLLSEY